MAMRPTLTIQGSSAILAYDGRYSLNSLYRWNILSAVAEMALDLARYTSTLYARGPPKSPLRMEVCTTKRDQSAGEVGARMQPRFARIEYCQLQCLESHLGGSSCQRFPSLCLHRKLRLSSFHERDRSTWGPSLWSRGGERTSYHPRNMHEQDQAPGSPLQRDGNWQSTFRTGSKFLCHRLRRVA